jgi:hypothetical protein
MHMVRVVIDIVEPVQKSFWARILMCQNLCEVSFF